MDENAAEADRSDYVVVARRYRPQLFDELVGQGHVAQALSQAIVSGRVGHAYLFTGARGVGKTSAARIFAKALNCTASDGPTPTPCGECDVCAAVAGGDDVDVIEIDGASNRGIDEIRQLRQNVAVRPSRARFKVYIIDEVHMLTKEAFNALLKTLEEPPEHVKFLFATTEPNKIPITILSRCQRFDFAGIESGSIRTRLRQIAEAEGVAIDDEALQILAMRAAGSMRDSQSLLEQLLAVGGETITAESVNSLLGVASAQRVADLARKVVDHDAGGALAELDAAISGGADAGQLIDQLLGYFRDVMTLSVGGQPDGLLYTLPGQADEAAAMGQRLGVPAVLALLQVLDQTTQRMRVSVHTRTLAEMAVVQTAMINELQAPVAASPGEKAGGTPSNDGNARPANGQAQPMAAARQNGASPPRISPQGAPPQNAAPRKQSETARRAPLAEGQPAPTPAPHQRAAPKPLASPPAAATPPPPSSADGDQAAPLGLAGQLNAQLAAGNAGQVGAGPPRKSRRQQVAEAAKHPFVETAMELFGGTPDKLRYTPREQG